MLKPVQKRNQNTDTKAIKNAEINLLIRCKMGQYPPGIKCNT